MRFPTLLAITVLLALSSDLVLAGTGQVINLPILGPGRKPTSGVRLALDTRWVTGSGYRPVRVRVAPLAGGPAPADRSFEVTIRPRGWYGGRMAGAATGTVDLDQGATFGETVINVPQTNNWTSYDVETYEDGRFLRDLSTKQLTSAVRLFYDTNESAPAILVLSPFAPTWSATRVPMYTGTAGESIGLKPSIARAPGTPWIPWLSLTVIRANDTSVGAPVNILPDVRVLAGRFPMSYYGGNLTPDQFLAKTATTDAATMRFTSDLPFLDIVPYSALPADWISLSGVDVIIASLADLQQLAQQDPEKWQAIRQWVSAGSLLCVSGAGNEFSRLPDLDALLRLASPTPDSGNTDRPAGQRPSPSAATRRPPDESTPDWITPSKLDNSSADIKALNNAANYWQQQAQQNNAASDAESSNRDLAWQFRYRPVDSGYVVAIDAQHPFPGTTRLWGSIFNNVPSRCWMWNHRLGISNQADNDHFWNHLIPGIGRAPIISFMVLISLFALVIGPVNYFLLWRRRRLYMLLVTVPAGALLVTSSLFLYATLADGLGIRARVRSYTQIDQRTGRAVAWSRQTYYAGLAPSGGLEFPRDSAVYALDHRPTSQMGWEDTSRRLIWDDQQRLREGYFLSRTLAQVMVVEPRETESGLQVTESDAGAPEVVNHLGADIQHLWLSDSEGNLFRGHTIGREKTATLEPVAPSAPWRDDLKIRISSQRLSYPEGFNPNNVENVTGIFGGRFTGGTPPAAENSMLEYSLRHVATGRTLDDKRSFVAIATKPPLVSLGVQTAEEVAGFHVIVGRW